MKSGIKFRRTIHYSLILSIVLIQLVILIFFYNEYFNGRKLSNIQNKIKENYQLRNLTDTSRLKLTNARNNLDDYLKTHDKTYLESYFKNLKELTGNIDQIKNFEKNNLSKENNTL